MNKKQRKKFFRLKEEGKTFREIQEILSADCQFRWKQTMLKNYFYNSKKNELNRNEIKSINNKMNEYCKILDVDFHDYVSKMIKYLANKVDAAKEKTNKINNEE
ncbi:hypothetical protein PQU95_02595 [Vogesella sp. DC21W]|uniref:Uncharacterized protein n=1 Tax=Vogesella aquatica TaxID=2984206 RepID=A0ABT5IU63_9NEIS|nr:hypothetical protein [Vogesella aquatica]MDC7716112.1 hypothetical protein [Vogesella aquatica]